MCDCGSKIHSFPIQPIPGVVNSVFTVLSRDNVSTKPYSAMAKRIATIGAMKSIVEVSCVFFFAFKYVGFYRPGYLTVTIVFGYLSVSCW